MDMYNMDTQGWLVIDKNYMDEHRIRSWLLKEKKDEVLQYLPESYDACLEALEEVVKFLCHRYPDMFKQEIDGDLYTIQNKMTGETFMVGEQDKMAHPLEIAARIAMEDVSILMKNEDNEHYL
jgi:hypothetical protein